MNEIGAVVVLLTPRCDFLAANSGPPWFTLEGVMLFHLLIIIKPLIHCLQGIKSRIYSKDGGSFGRFPMLCVNAWHQMWIIEISNVIQFWTMRRRRSDWWSESRHAKINHTVYSVMWVSCRNQYISRNDLSCVLTISNIAKYSAFTNNAAC